MRAGLENTRAKSLETERIFFFFFKEEHKRCVEAKLTRPFDRKPPLPRLEFHPLVLTENYFFLGRIMEREESLS